MTDNNNINKAFSSISKEYDNDNSVITTYCRKQVRENLHRFLKPNMKVLEINAGTGIDALYLLQNYDITLTTIDISDTMIEYMKRKRSEFNLQDRWQIFQLSFTELQELNNQKFHLIFSNFGGLNCIENLTNFTNNLETILYPNAIISLVIMPKICLWEIVYLLKGNWKLATRRLSGKTIAHINKTPFPVYYYNYKEIVNSFKPTIFKSINIQSIAPFSPSAAEHLKKFPQKFPKIYATLIKIDSLFNKSFPFNRIGDYLIVDLIYNP